VEEVGTDGQTFFKGKEKGNGAGEEGMRKEKEREER
jgi:hypothetical protein